MRFWSLSSASSSFAPDAQQPPRCGVAARSGSDVDGTSPVGGMGVVRTRTCPGVLQARHDKAVNAEVALDAVSTDDETTPSTSPEGSPRRHARPPAAEASKPGGSAAKAADAGHHEGLKACPSSSDAARAAKTSPPVASSSLLNAVEAVVRRVRVNLHVEDCVEPAVAQLVSNTQDYKQSVTERRADFASQPGDREEEASPLFPCPAPGEGEVAPLPCMLPGVCGRKVRMAEFEDDPSPVGAGEIAEECQLEAGRRLQSLKLATPSSCASAIHKYALTPTTPDPARSGFRFVEEDVNVVFFDFDGTLTATPGEAATQRWEKKSELAARSGMIRPRLEGLIEAGMVLGIMSKSTEQTIRDALRTADLEDLFQGPVFGKAVGFEGKAGFIEELLRAGRISPAGGLARVLLVDDDVRELDRARERGIQTFAAPAEGGLQESDFDELFAQLSLPSPASSPARS